MTPIFHVTHIDNVRSIADQGGLWSDNECLRRGIQCRGIAHQHIKDRRARRRVPVGPGGTLADYAPFYFAPRSPMLFAIHKGQVEGYRAGQGQVLHLVSTVEAVAQQGLSFVFTEGHAEMVISRFYADPKSLSELDWDVLRARYWADTDTDNDRKRRRQAEFLVNSGCPWELFSEIAVMTEAMRQKTVAVLEGLDHKPKVVVRSAWYY